MIVIDPDLLLAFRLKGRCEHCARSGPTDPHHLFGRGFGGGTRLDVRINLMALCSDCHRQYHDGHILRCTLIALVERRERLQPGTLEGLIYELRRRPK